VIAMTRDHVWMTPPAELAAAVAMLGAIHDRALRAAFARRGPLPEGGGLNLDLATVVAQAARIAVSGAGSIRHADLGPAMLVDLRCQLGEYGSEAFDAREANPAWAQYLDVASDLPIIAARLHARMTAAAMADWLESAS